MKYRVDRERRIVEYEMAEGVRAYSTMRDLEELPETVTQAHQTHEDRIAVITGPGLTREDLEGIDAMVTNVKGCAIGARTADCVPILIYDPANKAVAAVHSGWKGTVKRISAKAVAKMAETYGSKAEDLLAVIGPSIGPDSFQVGQEVVDQFMAAGFPAAIVSDRGEKVPGTMEGGLHIDLWEACRLTLTEVGVKPENILLTGIDTYENNDLLFSARREGIKCGRIINVIVLN